LYKLANFDLTTLGVRHSSRTPFVLDWSHSTRPSYVQPAGRMWSSRRFCAAQFRFSL